ncbi:pancreatic triacylglycerol lipase isoform X2 [Strongylocentrotus purpuratus]|uniref:Lipase domain-containing protein n=1 Tax=Strongylocentrotus purpuratus TaxID=7668 RepID=A0A7M7PKZ7_STRPU|nr:pancreatic triacylglycerol lipase isoform X2 [Strongylocentrotus purpuratus]
MEKTMAYTLLVLFSYLALTCWAREVCYEDIGCFDNGYPFYDPLNRPVSWLPESRDDIGTTFQLNTRNVPSTSSWQELSTYYPDNFYDTDFDPNRETKVITHGFTQSSSVSWMEEMVDEFLVQGDYNVIRVNWQRGALGVYGVSAANTRIVGAEVSLLIDLLRSHYGVEASSFHIIGHSLGAHVAGYAGERQNNPKVARITGLDPAGPYFEDMDTIVRLDTTDADFVDVIHTDTDPIYKLGYGMYAPCGHMDFFPNGGRVQPGCDQSLFEYIGDDGLYDGTAQFVACNHLRSIAFFKESINSDCPFLAFECTRDHDDYNYGLCFNDDLSARMGWQAPADYRGGEGNVYQINTNGDEPFCGHQYLFTLKMDEHRKAHDAKGQIFITLIGYNAQSSKVALTSETVEYYTSIVYQHMVPYDVSPQDTGGLSGLYFEWDYDPDWWWWDWEVIERPELFVHQIQVTDSEGNVSTMCGDYNGIKPGDVQSFWRTDTVCPSK